MSYVRAAVALYFEPVSPAFIASIVFVCAILTGCATEQQHIFGGGKPTTVTCKGKGAVSGGPYAFMADCGDGFTFSINVQ